MQRRVPWVRQSTIHSHQALTSIHSFAGACSKTYIYKDWVMNQTVLMREILRLTPHTEVPRGTNGDMGRWEPLTSCGRRQVIEHTHGAVILGRCWRHGLGEEVHCQGPWLWFCRRGVRSYPNHCRDIPSMLGRWCWEPTGLEPQVCAQQALWPA